MPPTAACMAHLGHFHSQISVCVRARELRTEDSWVSRRHCLKLLFTPTLLPDTRFEERKQDRKLRPPYTEVLQQLEWNGKNGEASGVHCGPGL